MGSEMCIRDRYDYAKPAKGEKNDGKTDSYKKIMFINAVTGEEIR